MSLESEEKGGAKKVLEELMAATWPNRAKDINIQIQEAKCSS